MRINKFIASSSQLSRRAADAAIAQGRVKVNGQLPFIGQSISDTDDVTLDDKQLQSQPTFTVVSFHKPRGYICSRDGQGSATIYDLLPPQYQRLNPIGRLDKYSSGLLLLTDNGDLANELTHPSFEKMKVYQITLDKPLAKEALEQLTKGVLVDEYISHLTVTPLDSDMWQVRMTEGKNRQIRKTFEVLGYEVKRLHRAQFGDYELGDLQSGMTHKLE